MIAFTVNMFVSLAEFIGNVFIDPLNATYNLFADIWNGVVDLVGQAVAAIVDMIAQIPGMSKLGISTDFLQNLSILREKKSPEVMIFRL